MAAVAQRIVVKMLTSHDDFMELTEDRAVLVSGGLVHHIVQLLLIAEAHAPDADLGEQVVFTDFAPDVVAVVVPGAVQSCIVKVGWEIVVLVAATGCHVTMQGTEGDIGHVASEIHHLDAVVLVFLQDVVAQLLGIVLATHGAENVVDGFDASA